MRQRQLPFLGLLLVVSLVAVLSQMGLPAREPYQPTETDRIAVIDTFLRSRGEGAVVQRRMQPVREDSVEHKAAEKLSRGRRIPKLFEQLSASSKVPDGLKAARRIVSADDLAAIENSPRGFWHAFHKNHPGQSYLVELSPLAFNADGTDCYFVASCYQDGLTGEVGIAHLHRGSAGWVVQAFEVFLVS